MNRNILTILCNMLVVLGSMSSDYAFETATIPITETQWLRVTPRPCVEVPCG